jgi:hypothetical protein
MPHLYSAYHSAGCHCYFIGRYNERFKQDARSFALPADPERAMALDHAGVVKRVCTYAIDITDLSSDLVRRGLALSPKMTTDVSEQNTQAIGFDGLNKNEAAEAAF